MNPYRKTLKSNGPSYHELSKYGPVDLTYMLSDEPIVNPDCDQWYWYFSTEGTPKCKYCDLPLKRDYSKNYRAWITPEECNHDRRCKKCNNSLEKICQKDGGMIYSDCYFCTPGNNNQKDMKVPKTVPSFKAKTVSDFKPHEL